MSSSGTVVLISFFQERTTREEMFCMRDKGKEKRRTARRFLSACILLSCLAAAFTPLLASAAAAAPKTDGVGGPTYPPQSGEYYPTSPKNYPKEMTNPYANARTVAFSGSALDVFLQTDMVTQIQFPAPPVLVNIGRPDGFTVEVIPEFNSVFVKPVAEVEITNLIVTTERGVYTFILKENPWKPFDMRLVVTDPYRNVSPADTQTLLWMAYNGVRPPEFQFSAMEIRNVENSQYVYDPVAKMGSRATVKRAVALPRANKSVYWIEFANVTHPDIRETSKLGTFMVDERSVWTYGLEEVAVPGTQSSGVPLLGKGDKVDMFLITNNGKIPSQLVVRYMMQGSPRNLPVEIRFAMNTGGKNAVKSPGAGSAPSSSVPAELSVDDRLQRMYEEQMRKSKTPTVSAPGEGYVDPNAQPQQTAPGQQAQYPGYGPQAPQNPGPSQPADNGKVYFVNP